ncbi:hypothetical protein N7535_004897 [Penicillium sp. DV-2018c]|nr:hypothetical protein N7535_004897 [Penicillium sp. DV-2018c]
MSFAYQGKSDVSEEGAAGTFLAHLPSGTPVYCYNRQLDMKSLFPSYSVEDSFIVLKHLPADILADHEGQLPGRCDYSPPLQILIITMPSQPHEAAACSFEVMIGCLARDMAVGRRVAPCGATHIDTPERSKQADRSWKPARQQREFPTVVLEIGFSEMRQKLESDIAWCINGSKGQVRMGITLEIERRSRSIEIFSWVPAFELSLCNTYITAGDRQIIDRRITNPPPPQMTQKILLTGGRDGSSPTTEGAPLTIPFRTLLLDEPGEGEGNFVLTAEMLHDLAERVWDAIDDAEGIEAKKRNKRHTA